MPYCPKCQAEVALEDVNVAQGVALCRGCGVISQMSEMTVPEWPVKKVTVDVTNPPKGCWYRDDGDTIVFGGSTRTWGAIFLVPFAFVWIGGVMSFSGFFVYQAFTGTGNGILIFPLLFMVPFWIAALFLFSQVAMSIGGKVEVRLRGRQAEVLTGVGRICWRRRFNIDEFSSVTEQAHNRPMPQSPFGAGAIALEGRRRLTFGRMLTEDRRFFVVSILRRIIEGR